MSASAALDLSSDDGRRTLHRYLASFSFSMLGTGLWLPLNAVYLNDERHLSPSVVGLYFLVLSCASIAANLVAATIADRSGPFRPYVAGGLLQGVGMIMLATASHPAALFAAGIVCGAGNGTFFACQTAVLTQVFGLEMLSTVYGRQYQIMNLAIGIGALSVGALLYELGPAAYTIGFCLNGLSYTVHVLNVVGPVRRLAQRYSAPRLEEVLPSVTDGTGAEREAPDQETGHGHDAASLRERGKPERFDRFLPYRDKHFLPVIMIQLCLVLFGTAQFEAVMPIVLKRTAELPAWAVTAFVVANCAGVVVLQPRATLYVNRRGPEQGIRAAMRWWLLLPLPALAAAVAGPLPLRLVAVCAVALVFAAGEVLLAPSVQPMAAARAPKGRLTTYTSSVSLAASVAMLTGPALLLPVFGGLGGPTYWIVLFAGTSAGLAILRLWVLRRPAAQAAAGVDL